MQHLGQEERYIQHKRYIHNEERRYKYTSFGAAQCCGGGTCLEGGGGAPWTQDVAPAPWTQEVALGVVVASSSPSLSGSLVGSSFSSGISVCAAMYASTISSMVGRIHAHSAQL